LHLCLSTQNRKKFRSKNRLTLIQSSGIINVWGEIPLS
jgi:hypothetical protein